MQCLTAQSGAMEQSVTGPLSVDDFNREILKKRKSLDKEIERFMAQKDIEFKKFERELRNQLQQTTISKSTQPINGKESPTIIARGFTVDVVPSNQELEADSLIDSVLSKATNSSTTTSTSNVIENPGEHKSSTTPPSRHSSDEDRELELGALLAPSYVPLLEGRPSPGPSKADSVDHSRISTSFDAQGNGSDYDRPQLGDRRSSSSPTGTGRTSKKSALKQSANSESSRGRKHVLFSINNQVISPSTSPASIRVAPPKDPPIPFSGLRELSAEDIRASRSHEVYSVLPNVPPSQPQSLSSRSYKDLVEPTVVTPPEELVDEDFNSISKDPLFETDEPIHPLSEEGWDLSPVERRSEDEADMISASPHVGSLPIQIRSNVRR